MLHTFETPDHVSLHVEIGTGDVFVRADEHDRTTVEVVGEDAEDVTVEQRGDRIVVLGPPHHGGFFSRSPKLDVRVTSGIEASAGRRRLVAALVECAHEGNALVVAEGVERVTEFEAMKLLGVDLGQGFYFGQPTERPMAVDPRLVRARPELGSLRA